MTISKPLKSQASRRTRGPRRGPVLASVFACAFAAAPLQAQDPDSTRARAGLPDTIVLGEGVRVSVARPRLAQAGGSGSIELRMDSMSVIPAPTLETVLRRIPLIQLRQNSRGEVQPALRGAEDRQIAVLVDGVPLSLGWDHRTDLSIVPLSAARSVSLRRGASSVLYGPNVVGGVVEIDVVRGGLQLPPPTPVSVAFGLDQAGALSLAASGGRAGDTDHGRWLVNAGVGYRDRPGTTVPDLTDYPEVEWPLLVEAGQADRRLNSDFTHLDAFVAARYLSDDGAWISTTASGFGAERGVPPETQEADPRLWRYADQTRFVAAMSAGTGLRSTGWGRGDLEASVGVDVGDFQIDSYESLAFQDVRDVEFGDDRTVTLRLLGDHTIGQAGDARMALTYADVFHRETLEPGGVSEYRQRLWSLAGETEWRLGGLVGNPALNGTALNLGFVVDGADTPESGDKPALGRLSDWGAHVGLSQVAAGGDLLLHGGVTRRVRFPSLRELYSGALGRFLANPELRPETQWSGELGGTWNGEPVTFQVVGFRQEQTDGIVRVSVETEAGAFRQRVNRDKIRSTGLELVASGDVGPLRFATDLTFQDTWAYSTDGDRSRPEYEPRWVSGFDVAFPLVRGVQATAGVEYQSSQLCLNADSGGFDTIEPNRSIDLEARRTFRRSGRERFQNVDVVLGVSNVLDAAVFDQCGLPRPGRTLSARIRLF